MPVIEIRTTSGAWARFECENGRLLDACDDARAPLPVSCRSATCGTCLVDVVAGQHLLEEAGADERRLLAVISTRAGQRLGCQARVRAGEGRVIVHTVMTPPE